MHLKSSLGASSLVIFWFFYEFLTHLYQIIQLRKHYQRARLPGKEPIVALVGDNLDEVNGIALHTRTLVRVLHKKGHRVYLVGAHFHSKHPRLEAHGGFIYMFEGRFSMGQPGYPESELVVAKIGLLLRFLKRYPIDIIEFQTPGCVSFMTILVAKIVGIKTIMHYRTDMYSYVDLLVKWAFVRWFTKTFVKAMTHAAGPVIVPSLAFAQKVQKDMNIPSHRITLVPRGVALNMFHPNKRGVYWSQLIGPQAGLRLLYVGRVSQEKNLDLFKEVVKQLPSDLPYQLVFVGEGPYLEHLQKYFHSNQQVHFTGVLRGEALAGIYADADCFIFPSLTDTFGNTVLEALASGTPCIVSDKGGPQEIIENRKSGLIFPSHQPQEILSHLKFLHQNPQTLQEFRIAARERSLQFTHENSADKFWEYYSAIYHGEDPKKKGL